MARCGWHGGWPLESLVGPAVTLYSKSATGTVRRRWPMRPATTPRRSALMARVRQRHTDLELAVRRLLTRIGARYRVNVSGLPGSPDVANRSKRKAIFVNGCFWHQHSCRRGRVPTSNREFWEQKLASNKERDDRKKLQLESLGYEVLVIWECELEDLVALETRLRGFWLGGKNGN